MKKLKYLLFLFLFTFNINAGIFGGGGADMVWQMKTYYEALEIKTNQIKMLRNELEKMRMMIEQIKNLPEDVLGNELGQYAGMINDLVAIQNEVKGLLGDARDFEVYLGQVYDDVKNTNYISMIDRYASTINNLSENSMKQSIYYQSKAQKSVNANAMYLKKQAKKGENPIQLLQTLNSWNSNLSMQISSITDMINNSNRIQAIDYLEKAGQIKLDQEQQKIMNQILEKRISEMRKAQRRKR
ncbi:MAG: hypothetical protein LBV03_01695 [Fusobacteriales bacterium]|jgi:hypothetical protein|nr:hypothetical protein [Fusobacteriales bacterium]